ncbi:DUF2530 domain-containing protein [Actinocorallia longicatena]|uniref:DUF2530 domain-containing protein n=1 Tax=Actinocorallia longicatena TaxID=111803 RepID=A0ABP6Q306_9ACTN
MARPRQPEPEPLKTNDVLIAVAGTLAWAMALVVLLVIGLPEDERWWYWVCGAGVVIGLFASWYTPRLTRSRAADEARRAADRATPEQTTPEQTTAERTASDWAAQDQAAQD